MRLTATATISLALFGAYATSLRAQTTPSRSRRTYTVEIATIKAVDYPAGSIEQAVNAAGFGEDVPPGFFFGAGPGTSYPKSDTGSGWLLMLTRDLGSAFEMRVLLTPPGRVGKTEGYRNDSLPEWMQVSVSEGGLGVTIGVHEPSRTLRLFAGPAVDVVRVKIGATDTFGGNGLTSTRLTPGAWIGGQFREPGAKRYFVCVTGGYHLTLSHDVGPTVFPTTAGGSETIEGFRVNPGHAFLSFGLGMSL